jgi:hypothetical protein
MGHGSPCREPIAREGELEAGVVLPGEREFRV